MKQKCHVPQQHTLHQNKNGENIFKDLQVKTFQSRSTYEDKSLIKDKDKILIFPNL